MKNKSLNNRGIALITVILIIAILVAVVIELNRSSRADIYDARNLSDGIKLTYIAKSGFYGAINLLTKSTNNYDTLRDDWAHMETISLQSNTLFTDGYFIVKVEDESGKIPLNNLSHDNEYYNILVRLLKQPEFELDERKAKEIADSIADWIDPDNDVPGQGAEDSYYSSLDPPYKAKNAPLDCIEELLMVKGITKEIYYGTKEKPGLAEYVNAEYVNAEDVNAESRSPININTAPKMVLRSLADGISKELADKIDEYREKEGSDLTNTRWLFDVSGISVRDKLITVKSNYFKIISIGKMNNMTKTVSGIVHRSEDNLSVQIIKWRQD